MTGPSSIVVVGGGVSGFSTAQELRARGYAGRLTLIDPQGLPYDRPPLSKEYLDGRLPAEKLAFVPESWFAEQAVALITDRVDSLDAATGQVALHGGHALDADVVVLATGGPARTLPVPGGDDPGLAVLRTKSDADRLRDVLVPGLRLAIIGAGLIGAEVASSASTLGTEVTLIDPVEIPGIPALGRPIAAELHAMHAAHGVHVYTGPTTAIERTGAGWLVRIAQGAAHGGADVEAEAVLLAVGMVPDVALAVGAGLDVDNGVLVDASQRSSNPAVFAVGDSARHRLPDGTLSRRHEHWESAMHGGQTAAAAILGQELPRPQAPWMWTDRYGVHVEAVGSMAAGQVVVRERGGRPWVAFALDDDRRLLGAAAIDGGQAVRAVRRLFDRGTVVDPAQLADPAVDLKKLSR